MHAENQPSVEDASFDLHWEGEAGVLAVSGEIDMVTAPRLQAELTAALDQRPARLVVDLTEVALFASAGLSALVAAYEQARSQTTLRVVAPHSAIARPLQLTGLDRKLGVCASRDEALATQ
ncbi:STAS domain-containing protein [Saccharopolyspora sp. CA-218241]|uniref:STAS domain-containing protein n=1 Tax=Saccharopolyspora sp. CA-218241 TaxID=3240027 RepID=UPI003D98871F